MNPGDSTTSPVRADVVIVWLGWTLLAVFVGIAACLGDIASNVRLFQIGYGIGFIGYGLLVYCVLRRRPAGAWSVWLVGCVVARVALFHTVPSDDLYRYLWEGRIQVAGHNPYVTAPDDPSLLPLRDENWSHINHRDYAAIYPPLAQLTFYAVALVNPTLYSVKAVYVFLDMVAVLLLAAGLKRSGRPPHQAIVYGLCPLTLTAVAIEGHVEGLLAMCLAGALLAHVHRRTYLCAAFIASAILTKIVPIVLLPWQMRRHPRAGLLAVVLLVAGCLPYADAGLSVFDSPIRFARETHVLGLAYAVLTAMLGSDAALWLGGLAVLGISLSRVWVRASLPHHMLAVFAAMIVFMPVVHYWYLIWVLVVLPFRPRVSWLVLAACMVFYFEAVNERAVHEVWRMPSWVPYFVYTPFLLAWTIEWWIGRGADQREVPGISTDLR